MYKSCILVTTFGGSTILVSIQAHSAWPSFRGYMQYECWRWFRPPLAKKRQVMCSSRLSCSREPTTFHFAFLTTRPSIKQLSSSGFAFTVVHFYFAFTVLLLYVLSSYIFYIVKRGR